MHLEPVMLFNLLSVLRIEAVEPAEAGFARLGQSAKDLVRTDPQVVANFDRGRANERDAGPAPRE